MMQATVVQDTNHLDLLNHESTIALIFGYFRKNKLLNYGIKYDDFVRIVSKYMVEPAIKFGNNNKSIDGFSHNDRRLYYINVHSTSFFVALDYGSKIMLSAFV